MKIQNSQGHIVEIPKSHQRIIKKHIKDGNHHLVSGMVNSYSQPEGMSEQFTWGGAAQGAMSGASTGAAFGPWGAAIGGVVGGIAGAISSGEQKKAQEKQQALEQQQLSLQMQQQQNIPIQGGGSYIPTFRPHGGSIRPVQGGQMINDIIHAPELGGYFKKKK